MFKKFITGFATGSLLLGSVVGVFADTTVEVSGNGSNSINTVQVKEKCTQKVSQSNSTTANVVLGLSGNTGGNTANDNTGAGVSITTGNVTNTAVVTVAGGDNTAEVPSCCCGEENGTNDVLVSGNGTNSINTVRVKKVKKSRTKQRNRIQATVVGSLTGTTGDNSSNDNTGGTVEHDTGNVTNEAIIDVSGGSNTL